MNEKIQYANMLEIPVNTCNVTYKPKKKRLFKKRSTKQIEEVKNQLVNRVNLDIGAEDLQNQSQKEDEMETLNNLETPRTEKKVSRAKGITAVTAFAIIGVLLAVVFLTNAFYPDSALKVFLGSIFNNEEEIASVTDERTFKDFSPVLCFSGSEEVVLSEGLISVNGEGSVYSTVDGEIRQVSVNGDGRYTVEIAHSDNFTSVISNLDFVYGETGDKVFSNIPVGYTSENLSMQFLDAEENVITNYEIIENAVVWGV